MTAAISPRTRSSTPAARAAARLSIAATATPFMNTLRRSFSAAASPAAAPTTSTGIPSGRKSSAKRDAPEPETSAGVPSPVPGTTPVSATSANCTGSSAASSRFSSGEAVLRSA